LHYLVMVTRIEAQNGAKKETPPGRARRRWSRGRLLGGKAIGAIPFGALEGLNTRPIFFPIVLLKKPRTNVAASRSPS
jgi:hypothetical protein